MRRDALGMFWRDEPVVKKVAQAKPKRTPPTPVWLAEDYLPGLEEARKFDVPMFSDMELWKATSNYLPENKDKFIFDVEIYENYFLCAFTSLKTGKVVYVELSEHTQLDIPKLQWIIDKFTLVGFNSTSFDLTIVAMALAGKTTAQMKEASRRLIEMNEHHSEVLKAFRVKRLRCDHIDLIEVAPLRASLKVYAGRLHAPRMQDLPFHPDVVLSEDQIAITRWYCVNDLRNTVILFEGLLEQIKLREALGKEYNMDLRGKSDAQIAEHAFVAEINELNGYRATRPVIPAGTCYRYRPPAFLRYYSPLLQWAFDIVNRAPFIVGENGSIMMPEAVGELKLEINGSIYRMGIGGLHSSEKTSAHRSTDKVKLYDYDVTSYYPMIILNQGLYPHHLGPNFLTVYRRTVERRIAAKRRHDNVTSDALKIVVNGSFGKLGSKWSNLYAPDLMFQVTLTGQLSLLMLIERLELSGIHVVSANTDGIVIKCPVELTQVMEGIVKQWEIETDFTMESSEYLGLFSKDVNNYLAVKKDGTSKTKGAYANPWRDSSDKSRWLHKNPTNTICIEAVEDLITKGIPIVTTVMGCNDITKFVSVRTVRGGAVKVYNEDHTEYLGKSIRWYYATGEEGEIVYASSGNKVPRSDGAHPLMDLPDTFPDNVDKEWYISEADKILGHIGYV